MQGRVRLALCGPPFEEDADQEEDVYGGVKLTLGWDGKFFRNRVRKDGTRFLEGFTEAEVVPVPGNKPTALNPSDPHSAKPTGGEETVGLMAR
jgi:hypothetical protein